MCGQITPMSCSRLEKLHRAAHSMRSRRTPRGKCVKMETGMSRTALGLIRVARDVYGTNGTWRWRSTMSSKDREESYRILINPPATAGGTDLYCWALILRCQIFDNQRE